MADCLHRAVKLAAVIIHAADHGFDGAVIIHNHNCAFADVFAFCAPNVRTQDFFSAFLQLLVKRGHNIHINRTFADIAVDFVINILGKVLAAAYAVLLSVAYRQGFGGSVLFLIYVAALQHIMQNDIGAFKRFFTV